MKLLVSLGLGLTAALIGLDFQNTSGWWDLPRALEPRYGDSGASAALPFAALRQRAWFKRPKHMPWDEICADLAFHVRAGNTLVQAIQLVSQEGTSDAHKKLGKAYTLYETGVPIFEALAMVSQGDGELSMVAAILEIGSISGGDTAALLWRASEILRRRRVFLGEVNARLSEARITSWLLIALPWIIGLFMFRHDPGMLEGFVASREGRLLLVAAVILWAVGGLLLHICVRSVYPWGVGVNRHAKGERGRKVS